MEVINLLRNTWGFLKRGTMLLGFIFICSLVFLDVFGYGVLLFAGCMISMLNNENIHVLEDIANKILVIMGYLKNFPKMILNELKQSEETSTNYGDLYYGKKTVQSVTGEETDVMMFITLIWLTTLSIIFIYQLSLQDGLTIISGIFYLISAFHFKVIKGTVYHFNKKDNTKVLMRVNDNLTIVEDCLFDFLIAVGHLYFRFVITSLMDEELIIDNRSYLLHLVNFISVGLLSVHKALKKGFVFIYICSKLIDVFRTISPVFQSLFLLLMSFLSLLLSFYFPIIYSSYR